MRRSAPAEVRPVEVRPAEVRAAEDGPSEIRLAEVRPADVRPGEVRPAEVWSYVGILYPPLIPGVHAFFEYDDVFSIGHVSSLKT